MPKASDLKKSDVIEIEGHLYIVKNIDVKSPSSRGASTLYKVRFNKVRTKQKFEQTYKGDDVLNEVELIRRKIQYSYNDGEQIVFMDEEDYSQFNLAIEDLQQERLYLTDGLGGIIGLMVEEQMIGIELPQSVIMEIADTVPAIKGASAAGRTKTASFATGLSIQVPEYLSIGDAVKINTQEGKFMSRA